MKISVIGYSGSGKSTLAKWIAERTGLDLLYLDTVHWLPGWVERPREQSREIVKEFLDTHEHWVIDGSYGPLHFQRRMEESDLIVFLNFNRITCLYRAFKRYGTHKRISRESMTEGCPERIAPKFLWWLIFSGRTKRRRKKFKSLKSAYAEKFIEIKRQKDLKRFKEKLSKMVAESFK